MARVVGWVLLCVMVILVATTVSAGDPRDTLMKANQICSTWGPTGPYATWTVKTEPPPVGACVEIHEPRSIEEFCHIYNVWFPGTPHRFAAVCDEFGAEGKKIPANDKPVKEVVLPDINDSAPPGQCPEAIIQPRICTSDHRCAANIDEWVKLYEPQADSQSVPETVKTPKNTPEPVSIEQVARDTVPICKDGYVCSNVDEWVSIPEEVLPGFQAYQMKQSDIDHLRTVLRERTKPPSEPVRNKTEDMQIVLWYVFWFFIARRVFSIFEKAVKKWRQLEAATPTCSLCNSVLEQRPECEPEPAK